MLYKPFMNKELNLTHLLSHVRSNKCKRNCVYIKLHMVPLTGWGSHIVFSESKVKSARVTWEVFHPTLRLLQSVLRSCSPLFWYPNWSIGWPILSFLRYKGSSVYVARYVLIKTLSFNDYSAEKDAWNHQMYIDQYIDIGIPYINESELIFVGPWRPPSNKIWWHHSEFRERLQ